MDKKGRDWLHIVASIGRDFMGGSHFMVLVDGSFRKGGLVVDSLEIAYKHLLFCSCLLLTAYDTVYARLRGRF